MECAVPRTLDSLATLVGFARGFLVAEGLPGTLASDLDLVIEELFTNLVRHAQGGGEIGVTLERVPEGIRVMLRAHELEPFDPTTAPRVTLDRPLAERRAGGLGIHFVRELCTGFGYEWHAGQGTTRATLRVAS